MYLIDDPFLSEALGLSAFRLEVESNSTVVGVSAKVSDLVGAGPAFVYVKVEADRLGLLSILEDAGFRLADTNIQLQKKIEQIEMSAPSNIHFARSNDETLVRKLAKNSFKFSRFHLDPHISKKMADHLKSAWAGNYFLGQRGDAMIVAETSSGIGGFLQLLFRERQIIIDLIAVSREHRRNGIARDMIHFAQMSFDDYETMVTGTQAANIGSLAMYESMGFKICSAYYILHLHFPKARG